MSGTSAKAIFLEFFRTQELLRHLQNILPFQLHPDYRKNATGGKPETVVRDIRNRAKKLSFDHKTFDKFLQMTIDGLIAGQRPKAAINFVSSHRKILESRIHAIPNTLNKAYDALRALIEVEEAFKGDQVYDAMVLLSEEVSAELIASEVQNWKEEAKRHRDEHRHDPFYQSDIFWVSRDFMETIDGVSRYRFREHFGFSEFQSTFEEVESMLATSLLEGSSGMEAVSIPFFGDQRLTSVAYNLWLVSRSRNLPNRISDFVNVALRRIAGWQSPDGWWTDFHLTETVGKDVRTGLETFRHLPSTYISALCTLNLLKLSTSEPLRENGIRGAQWLLERQNPDGSWSQERVSEKRITSTPDVFLSLLSLEALIRSGIGNIKHSIELGIDWLVKQQNKLGMWNDDGFPFPFMTVLALELMKLKASFPNQLTQYQSISRGFLKRSVQFALEESSNSHRLAIITAFQGIEAFLYSVLSYPTVNIKIFRNADETIGMRKALVEFQTYLQQKGEIKPNEVIPYRNSLDRLAYLRDQVVHKGVDITATECRPLVDDALRFAMTYSLNIFRFDIFA
jgi:hypothetical protein